MPNPGTFTGSCSVFLKEQLERYAHAVKDGNINDVVADIQCRYFKRYPITLAHDKEPSQEWLDQVNDNAPDLEIEPPNVDGMSPEDASTALREHADLMKKLKDRKDSIRRRLHYIYSKENDPKPSAKSGLATDIVSALTAKILGVDSKMPCQKTAYNLWGPQHREIVDPVFNKCVEDAGIPTNQQIVLRSAIYKELFEQLPGDKQELWAKAAIHDHEKAVWEIRKNLEKGASTTPQDRQCVIAALPTILEPIFDLLAEYTGWRFSGIAGGPEPADGGRLNMIMIHSGVVPGTVKVDFGSDQHESFKKKITPAFGSYLKKCYTIEECRARALPEGFDICSLADVDADGSLDLHTFEINKEHVEASKSHKAKHLFEKEVKPRKGKKHEASQDGVPSPPVRFGPPIGKTKLRDLPSKDKPKGPTPSRLDPYSESSNVIFSQGFTVEDLGNLPQRHVLTPDDASSLYGAAAMALQCYVSTSSRTDPATPAPSRDPIGAESHNAVTTDEPFTQPSPPAQNALTSPTVGLSSLLPSPAVSCPALPPAVSRPASPPVVPEHGAAGMPASEVQVPSSRPATAPLHPAAPPSAPTTPSSHSVMPPLEPLTLALYSQPAIPPSQTTMPHCSASPIHNDGIHGSDSISQTATRLPTPSGAVTVPDLPPVNNNGTNERRETRTPSGSSEKQKAQAPNRDLPKKKQHTDPRPALHPAFVFDIPAGCPRSGWVQDALDLLTSRDLGATWRALILAWLHFEEKSGFSSAGERLSSHGWPSCVGEWLKHAHSPRFVPQLGNLDLYERTFVGWWNSLQPDWWNAGDEVEVGGGRSGDDWSALEGCSGTNGILSALAALFFWGSALADEGNLSAGWTTAVADALYVLQQLV